MLQVGNLPPAGSRLVGRDRELLQARTALRRGRVLTLTGMPGVGKTRLALRVATQARRLFPDGMWLIELAPVQDGELLPATVAATIGVRETALGIQDRTSRRLTGLLTDYLADKRMLLILDNCEHLLDSCAWLADALLRAAPGLRIMTTGRQPLGLVGEQVLTVPPLAAPDRAAVLPTEVVEQYDAVRLFADRAAAASSTFRITEDNCAAVGRLCHRLDGNPLAIELAAVRVRAMPVERILDRLDDYFSVLSEGSAVSLPRLRTLRGTIDWSFGLCSPAQQALWRRLTVFRGGFGLADAEAVCAGRGMDEAEVFDSLAELVDMSIVERAEQGSSSCYRLPAMIREYGQELLVGTDEESRLRRAHRDHYLRLVERAETELMSGHQAHWAARLRREHANLRAAAEYCLSTPGEATAGLRLAAGLGRYCLLCSSIDEARHWLDRVLNAEPAPTPDRAKALWVTGWLTLLQGETVEGLALLGQCRELARDLGDALALRRAEQFTGLAAIFQGDFERAATLLRRALESHQAAGDADGEWLALYQLALASSHLGDHERAIAYGERCLTMCRSREAPWSEAHALWVTGLAVWWHGDPVRATTLLRDALRLKSAFGDAWGVALCLEALAWTAPAEQSLQAARLLGAADRLWRSMGTFPFRLPALTASHGECETALLAALGVDGFADAVRRGAELPLDDVIAWALGEESVAGVS